MIHATSSALLKFQLPLEPSWLIFLIEGRRHTQYETTAERCRALSRLPRWRSNLDDTGKSLYVAGLEPS